MIKLFFRRGTLGLLAIALALSIVTTTFAANTAYAASCDYDFSARNDFGQWLDNCDSSCTTPSGGTAITAGNQDYQGREILSAAQLSTISANQPIYEQAAKEANIPWQMIAVIHLRESGLHRFNPENGQGIYQDAAKANGPYPYTNGNDVSDAEFLRQTTWAAQFLRDKSSNPDLLAKGDQAQVKDTFFGYNGRAAAYEAQAKSLGFSDAYEGSPYVVNMIDANRDPTVNPSGWGQIKTDGGSIVYPANKDYGAFVVYASLAGLQPTACSDLSGTLNEKITKIATAELDLWTNGQLKAGTDFTKYTYGTQGDWCAWFVSWVLKEAGHPVDSTATPQWPLVSDFLNRSSDIGFVTHANGDGYTPKAGDLAIYEGHTHINIVVGYSDSGSMITIGGNQGAGGNGSFNDSVVSRSVGYGESATSYVEVR